MGVTMLATASAAAGGLWLAQRASGQTPGAALECQSPYITDGDTLHCAGARVRLLGIDAPELPGHCRRGRQCVEGDPFAARDYLVALTRTTVVCIPQALDRYGRTLARCSANGVDLSCAMLRSGHAERRYADIRCR